MSSVPHPSSRRFRFDAYEADPRTAELTRHGERVPLQEIPFRFLATLLERPGELVSREELREPFGPWT